MIFDVMKTPSNTAFNQKGESEMLSFKSSFRLALLHKSGDGQGSPFPGQTHPTASVTGMPSAVKPFRTATRTWNSAT